jgi:hypothetical protein
MEEIADGTVKITGNSGLLLKNSKEILNFMLIE